MEPNLRFNSPAAEKKFWRERYNLFRKEVEEMTQKYDAQLNDSMATIEDITEQLTAARKHAEGLNAALRKERKARKTAKQYVRHLRQRIYEMEKTNGLLSYSIEKYEELQRSLDNLSSSANGQEQEQEQDSQEQDSQEDDSQED